MDVRWRIGAQFNAKMSAQRDQRVAIRALLDAGMNVSEVARETGASRNTVANVRDYGVERKVYQRGNEARPAQLVAHVENLVGESPNTSVRALARETGTAEATMRRLVKEDLGMYSYVKQERPLLSEETRRRRKERATLLLNRIKRVDAGATILFSDEKWFTLAQYHNRRNTKVVLRQGETPDERRVQGVAQRPAGLMFLGVVASDGRVAPPIFVEPGMKIDATAYQTILRQELKPWVNANFLPGTFIFQQDGATAHTAASTQTMIKEELGWRYWSKEMWPPSSPDLNPLDYGVWSNVARIACESPAPNIDTLRQHVAQAWTAQEPAQVRQVCRGFWRRLEVVVAAQGGYIDL